MTLLITMLPIYVFGNLHCLGMCGPLVMMIGQHRYRYCYFIGRVLSFTLVAMLAGEIGALLNLILKKYQIPAITSFFFGGIILMAGICALLGLQYPGFQWLSKHLAKFNHSLSMMMLRDSPWPTFLFGFFTVMLPCGQTLIVFSACALSGDPFIGMINGLAFALLTSPSLLFAMNIHSFIHTTKQYYNLLLGVSAFFIGFLAICRGLADLNLINHWVLNPGAELYYHIVIF
jgi:uncharacterized protein